MNSVHGINNTVIICTEGNEACEDFVKDLLNSKSVDSKFATVLHESESKADPVVLAQCRHVIYLGDVSNGAALFQRIRMNCG